MTDYYKDDWPNGDRNMPSPEYLANIFGESDALYLQLRSGARFNLEGPVSPLAIAAKDEHAMDIARLFKAVAEDEIREQACVSLVSIRFNREWGRLAGQHPDVSREACKGIVSYLRGSYLASALRTLQPLR